MLQPMTDLLMGLFLGAATCVILFIVLPWTWRLAERSKTLPSLPQTPPLIDLARRLEQVEIERPTAGNLIADLHDVKGSKVLTLDGAMLRHGPNDFDAEATRIQVQSDLLIDFLMHQVELTTIHPVALDAAPQPIIVEGRFVFRLEAVNAATSTAVLTTIDAAP